MTTVPAAALDQAELIKLAIDASKNSNHGAALAYLKEAASRADATAIAHYLLGAEYAQIQMMDRAIAEMETALTLDPSLSTARIQLALLLLGTRHDIDGAARAAEILRPLNSLHANDALRYFGEGLSHLIRNEYQNTIALFMKGMELNSSNPALNQDMQRIITEIGKLPPEVLNRFRDADVLPEDPSARHIFLSAYTGNRNQ